MPRRSAMHAQPKRTLKRLIKQYGPDLVHDPRRTEALLRDLCGQYSREIFVLTNAQKQRVPAELLAAPNWMPQQAVHARLSRTLQTKLALTEEAAEWAVDAWAEALGLVTQKGPTRWPLPSLGFKWLIKRGRGQRRGQSGGRQVADSGVKSKQKSQHSGRAARGQQAEVGRRIPLTGWTVSPKLVRHALQAKLQLGAEPWRTLWMGGALLAATLAALVLAAYLTQMPATANLSLMDRRSSGGESAGAAGPGPASDAAQESRPTSTGLTDAEPTPTPISVQDTPSGLSPASYLLTAYSQPLWGRVNADGLLIREGPSTDYPYISVLRMREAVQVVEFSQDGQWSMIAQPRVGWISNDYVHFESQDNSDSTVQLRVRQVRTQPYDTTVRLAPQPHAEIAATLPPNTTVVAVAVTVDEPAGWLQITEPIAGWLSQNDVLEDVLEIETR